MTVWQYEKVKLVEDIFHITLYDNSNFYYFMDTDTEKKLKLIKHWKNEDKEIEKFCNFILYWKTKI